MDKNEFTPEDSFFPEEQAPVPDSTDHPEEQPPAEIFDLAFQPEEPPAEEAFDSVPLVFAEQPEDAREPFPPANTGDPSPLPHDPREDPEASQDALLFDLGILEDPEPEKVPGKPEAAAADEMPEPETLLPELPPEEPADQEYRDGGKDFDKMFDAPASQPQSPPRDRPTRKGRPKRKKGEGLLGIPNILATFVWLALILAIGVTAGRMLWVCAADVLAFGREDKPVTITIYEADDLESITNKLYNAGLIRYKSLFSLYASISDAGEKIKPGIYDLNTLYDYHALVNFMTPRSNREVIKLTIPEGYTCRQIFDLLEENRVCTAVDAASYAANGELDDYWFLENVARGSEYCLEGYLFPDTYEFYKNSTPREALQKMLNNFENKFSEEMRAQIDALNENVTGGGYTVREVTIVASLIEKESAAPAESPSIAGVIYNRLHNWGGTPAYLNIDAAIVYAQDGDATTIDTSVDSPYNTYLHTGLTPTPISNPGLASLQAALQPESHGYYFYVLNPATGMHQFSATQAEHDAYVAEFYG